MSPAVDTIRATSLPRRMTLTLSPRRNPCLPVWPFGGLPTVRHTRRMALQPATSRSVPEEVVGQIAADVVNGELKRSQARCRTNSAERWPRGAPRSYAR